MKISYEACSPGDHGERIAQGELDLPDDAGRAAILGALENAVEQESAVVPGSQVRVIAARDGEQVVSHVWDHR